MQKALEDKKIEIKESSKVFVPTTHKELNDAQEADLLAMIEKMEEDVVWTLAGEIPPEWYGGEWDELEKLVRTLIVRRGLVRELIEAFRVSPRRPFPEWREQA